MRPPVSRRQFVSLSAAALTALLFRPRTDVIIGSTLPLPGPHQFFPETDALLTALLERETKFDALLLPAYAAAELIRRKTVRPLAGRLMAGPPGRAHDPAGAFTLPYRRMVAALVYRGERPASASLEALWSPQAIWPAEGRLVIGVALLRRGYPLNPTHPGHLAQVEKDLCALRPQLTRHPLRALKAGRGSVALALISEDELTARQAAPPMEGRIQVEYDWVIPRSAAKPDLAEQVVRQPSAVINHQAATFTLAPLPAAVRARYAEIWARVQLTAQWI